VSIFEREKAVRKKANYLRSGAACALLLAGVGGLAAAGAGSAKADTIISIPPSVTYLTQTLPDTSGGNSYLFVAANGEIMVTSLAGKQITTFDAGYGIGGLALSADGATLYASVTSGAHADSVAAITVSTVASGTPGQVFYPLTPGDQPGSLAVQSGKVWVSYNSTAGAVTTWAIGAIDLAAAGTFEPAAAPGSWTKALDLAADPKDTGVLVAVADESPAKAATYDTAKDPATALAAQGDLGTGGTACTYPGEIAVVPGGQQFAAACDGPGSVYTYRPADIGTWVASYFADGGGTSQAIAVAVDADGSVAVANRTNIFVYKPGGALLTTLAIPAGAKIDEGYGLEWADTAAGPDLAAVYQSTTTKAYTIQIFDNAQGQRPTLTFTATAKAGFGHPITLSGTAVLPGGAGDTAKVKISRNGPGGSVTLSVTPSGSGAFKVTDTPKAVGTYTYTAVDGTASATATAKVVKDVPTLKITTAGGTVSYRTVLHVTATLGATYVSRTLTIYAGINGSAKKRAIASGKVNARGQLSVAYAATQSTTFEAVYAGDADDAPVHAATVVSVRALVRETLSGDYGTRKSGRTTYLLYHHTGKVTVTAAVTPAHPGACVTVQTQEFYKGAWHASGTTGCTKLSTAGKATILLPLSKDQLGRPYRIRADFASNSKANANGTSGWQYFLVEK
jgi:hypothetical protein